MPPLLHLLGWFVWLLLTALALCAGYAVSAAAFGDRNRPERWAVTLMVALALVIGLLQLWGAFGLIRAWTVGPSAVLLFGLAIGWALRRMPLAQLRQLAREDLRSPQRLVRDAVAQREPLTLAIPLGALVFVTAAVLVWIYKTWNYDAAVYHSAITGHLVQDGGTALQQTHSPWVKGYPVNVSLVAAWNALFQRDNRLDDSPQLPFVLVGALIVAAWGRRLGASAPAAAGIGALFLLLPPIMLQLPTGQVDIACGAMLTAALYYSAFSPEGRDRWMFLVAFGIYVGTKFTGLFHLLLFAPVALIRLGVELKRAPGRRRRVALDVVLALAFFMLLASPKYFQNLHHHGNPMWPFTARVPVVGITFPGLFDSAIVYGATTGRAEFFGMPGDVAKLWESWMHTEPVVWPDVRQGGFGPLFRWLLLPALLLVALSMLRPRNLRWGWPVLLLLALTLAVPAAWWPRYTIGAATAGLVALAVTHAQVKWRWARIILSLGALALAGYGAGRTVQLVGKGADFYMWPRHLVTVLKMSGRERAELQVVDWLWPTHWAQKKEAELGPGDVITYDESADFLSEYFTYDYQGRVVHVPSGGPPEQFVKRIRELGARWVGVRAGSPAERALRAAGAEFLFRAPRTASALYRMP